MKPKKKKKRHDDEAAKLNYKLGREEEILWNKQNELFNPSNFS